MRYILGTASCCQLGSSFLAVPGSSYTHGCRHVAQSGLTPEKVLQQQHVDKDCGRTSRMLPGMVSIVFPSWSSFRERRLEEKEAVMASQPCFQLSLCTKSLHQPGKSEEESPTQLTAVMLLESLSTVPLIPQETYCDLDMLYYSLGAKAF